MGYMHIDNLYKFQDVLLFKEVYAMEKIHGTSAHIAWKNKQVRFFSGGVKHKNFCKLFSEEELTEAFIELGQDEVVIFGEAYGGKCQKMSDTYGKELKFVAFEVKIGDHWLDVPVAERVATRMGFEFVHYVKVPATIEAVNTERDKPSVQAARNGMGEGKMREGIVIRPLKEFICKNGKRVVAKHKGEKFSETRTPREVSPEKAKILSEANEIALEWATDMRLAHILDKLKGQNKILDEKLTKDVIMSMFEDVEREGRGEIVMSKEAKKAIGSRTAQMYHKLLKEGLGK